jgi:hypothetical protein
MLPLDWLKKHHRNLHQEELPAGRKHQPLLRTPVSR